MTRGTWLILAATWIFAACGSPQAKDSGGDGEPPPDLVIAVDWALEEIADPAGQGDPRTRVSLALTNETGATNVEPMGDYAGRCTEPSATGPGARGDDLLLLSCRHSEGGTELRVRRYGSALVLLRAPASDGELAFEEGGRVAIPTGAQVRAKE